MKQIGEVQSFRPAVLFRFLGRAFRLVWMWIGIAYCMLSLCCATTFRSRKQRMSKSNFAPPVSILKPLCGLDPHGYESLRSHCEQDYPEFEIIFGIRNRNDAAIPTVQRLMAEF